VSSLLAEFRVAGGEPAQNAIAKPMAEHSPWKGGKESGRAENLAGVWRKLSAAVDDDDAAAGV
jgi:hypothetical protein